MEAKIAAQQHQKELDAAQKQQKIANAISWAGINKKYATTISRTDQLDALKQQGIAGFQSAFSGMAGSDGYVNPKDYGSAKLQWMANGLSGSDFDQAFAGYRNPYDPLYGGIKSLKNN